MLEWIAKYWLEVAFGVVVAALTGVMRSVTVRLKKQQVENQALRDGMRSLLRSQIETSCERAFKDGFCGPRLRDSINDLYRSYHALGGNSTTTSLVHQAMELPVMAKEDAHG